MTAGSRTWWLLTAMLMVGLLQIWLAYHHDGDSLRADIAAAGLLKPLPPGEWWRTVTAPLLHVNWLHLLFNLSAMIALASAVESYCRRYWTPLVWMVGALAGSLVSVALMPHSSVGASGGILALHGFLLILAWRLRPMLPNLFTGLAQGLVLLLLMGVLLPDMIDNAAHAGGLIAGLVLGLLHPLDLRKQAPPPVEAQLTTGPRRFSLLVDALLLAQIGWTCWVLLDAARG